MALIELSSSNGITDIAFNDPDRRNALGEGMFDALDKALATVCADDAVRVVLLRGNGKAFCAGFDLGACIERPELLERFILRLRDVNRALRRCPVPVLIIVHGAAIAGGCAIISAGDLVITSPDATLGYPVHRLGVSPAVSTATLTQAVGDGPARDLLMSGRLIDGIEAHRIGLASHLSSDAMSLEAESHKLASQIASHGQHALRVTKTWLNELDGSLDDDRLDAPAEHSAKLAFDDESQRLLRAFWATRKSGRE